MKQLTISIPNMQSTHCQMKVYNAVKGIKGVQIENVEAGKLTASFTSINQENKLINAIEKAGYTVSEEKENNASNCSTGCCGN